jgi:hypothetical protein
MEEKMNEMSDHGKEFVIVGDKRLEVSICDSEIGRTVTLVLLTNDPANPRIVRFTDDDGATFRYKGFESPLTSVENDQQRIGVLRHALDKWRRLSAP